MQIEAIYNQGKLEFSQPIRFRHDYFTVMVEVPEQEIVNPEPNAPALPPYHLPSDVIAEAEKARQLLDDVMNAPLPPDDELLPLSTKQLSRIEAFALREDR